MGPRDRHSILRFIAFCQNNILCAAIFCESELGADVAPEQFHVGEGRQETQNKDGSFRLWPGKKSRGLSPALCGGTCSLCCFLWLCLCGFHVQRETQSRGRLGSLLIWSLAAAWEGPGCLAGLPWAAALGEGRCLPRGSGLCLHPVCPRKAPGFSPKHGVPQLPPPREAGRSRLHRAKGRGRLRAARTRSLALSVSSSV